MLMQSKLHPTTQRESQCYPRRCPSPPPPPMVSQGQLHNKPREKATVLPRLPRKHSTVPASHLQFVSCPRWDSCPWVVCDTCDAYGSSGPREATELPERGSMHGHGRARDMCSLPAMAIATNAGSCFVSNYTVLTSSAPKEPRVEEGLD